MIVIEGPEAGGHLGFKREELEESKKPKLEEITKEKIELIASGRTDAGVHAIGQVANFKTNTKSIQQ